VDVGTCPRVDMWDFQCPSKRADKGTTQPTPLSCTVIGVHAVPGDGSAVLIDAGGARGIRIGDRATRLALAPLAPLASLGLVTNSLDRANTARLPGVSAHERFGGPGLRHRPTLARGPAGSGGRNTAYTWGRGAGAIHALGGPTEPLTAFRAGSGASSDDRSATGPGPARTSPEEENHLKNPPRSGLLTGQNIFFTTDLLWQK
jgi:hypothetical protein